MAEIRDRDTSSRNRIVSETDRNFFVEAGAGSGKTTMLVNRMVAMVEQGKDISKICAITFTKAAAGEFYDRFQKLLMERSNPKYQMGEHRYAGQLPVPTDETRRNCEYALQNIDLCFMGTIDSFCNMILSEHPSEAGIPSDTTVMTEKEQESFYRNMYVRISNGEFGEELRERCRTFQAFHRKGEEVFLKGITLVMENRNAQFHYEETPAADLDYRFAKDRQGLISLMNFLQAHRDVKYPSDAKNQKAWEELDDIAGSIRKRWSTHFSEVLYALKTLQFIRLKPEAAERYGYSLGELFEPGGARGKWLSITIGGDNGLYQQMETLRYHSSMSFLCACMGVLEKESKESGRLTFFDYLYYLRNMLKNDAEQEGKLIRYIYDRHSYFLIDEFQDTNPMQAEIFFYLAAQKLNPEWSSCIPRPGALFIVGDPKQSIYRFRGADVTSFLRVKKLFSGETGEVLYLSRNFRSIRSLCGYFNRVFQEMLPCETKDQSKFELIPILDEDRKELQGVYTYRAYTGKSALEYPEQSDPVRIGSIIQTLVGNCEYQITTGKDKTPRPIRYRDIMVITYGKKKLEPIVTQLKSLGIPVKVEGNVSFETNEALRTICQLYCVVADMQDNSALYGVLTGSLFGIEKEELLSYVNQGQRLSVAGLRQGDCLQYQNKTALVLDQLREAAMKAQKLTPAAVFSFLLDEFEIFRKVSTENLEILYYALELLRSAQRSGTVTSLKEGAEFLNHLIEGEADQERCLSLTKQKDCVHMANLHKVKGLEAPVVILAASSGRMLPVDRRIEHREDGAHGYVFSLGGDRTENGGSVTYFSTSQYQDEQDKETESMRAEGDRLIYVAATRARNVLILCDSVYISRGKEVEDSKWKPLMGLGTPDFFSCMTENAATAVRESEEVDAVSLYEKGRTQQVLSDRSMEISSYEMRTPSHLRIESKLSSEERKEESLVLVDSVHRFPALLGTMMHRLMEIMVTSRNKAEIKSTVEEIIEEYRTEDMKSLTETFQEALYHAAVCMQNGGFPQTNGVPGDILAELLSAQECYCEVPFCYREMEENKPMIWNGVMDVIYKKAGIWHIVDYKTNLDGTDLDQKYQEQLKAYKKAFFAITGEEAADALTYHINI